MNEILQEVEDYIRSVEDSSVRRMLMYRYIDKLTWRQVARKMGDGYTEDAVRKSVCIYLDRTY